MKKAAVALALLLVSLALVACGSSSSDDSTSGGGSETSTESSDTTGESKSSAGGATVSFEADPSALAYTTDTATAKAGKVTVAFSNPSALTHDVAIEDSSGKEIGGTELIAEGSDSTVVDLKPGKYTFFCTVPGHREAGMEGTLTVE